MRNIARNISRNTKACIGLMKPSPSTTPLDSRGIEIYVLCFNCSYMHFANNMYHIRTHAWKKILSVQHCVSAPTKCKCKCNMLRNVIMKYGTWISPENMPGGKLKQALNLARLVQLPVTLCWSEMVRICLYYQLELIIKSYWNSGYNKLIYSLTGQWWNSVLLAGVPMVRVNWTQCRGD